MAEDAADATFDALLTTRIARDYQRAFKAATGIALALLTPKTSGNDSRPAKGRSWFCRIVAGTSQGRETCRGIELAAQRRAAESLAPQRVRCFAGLDVAAVPVVVDGKHVATLMCGPVAPRRPRQPDFTRLAERLRNWGLNEELSDARKAYFQLSIISEARFRGLVRLLTLFAQHLAEHATQALIARHPGESPAIVTAKEFVQLHAGEPISMRQAAQQAHLSPHYFSRIFKATTGMTFTEYVGRVRVEKAKALLLDPFARVSEVAYASGFGSVQWFNFMFRKHVGMSPTEYRGSLPAHYSI